MDVISKEERAKLDAQNKAVEDKAWWAIGKLKIPMEEHYNNPLLTLAVWLHEMSPTNVPVWLERADMHPEETLGGCPNLTDLIVNGPRITYSEEEEKYVPVEADDYPWGTLDAEEFLKEKDPQQVLELAGQAIFSGDLEMSLDEIGPLDSLTDITRD